AAGGVAKAEQAARRQPLEHAALADVLAHQVEVGAFGLVDVQRLRQLRQAVPGLGKLLVEQSGRGPRTGLTLVLPDQQAVVAHSTTTSMSRSAKRARSRTPIARLVLPRAPPTRPILSWLIQNPGTLLSGLYSRDSCTSWPMANGVAAKAALIASLSTALNSALRCTSIRALQSTGAGRSKRTWRVTPWPSTKATATAPKSPL